MGIILSPEELNDLALRFPEVRQKILGEPTLKPVAAVDSGKVKRKNKYGATRTEYGGRAYDSKAEASHAERLDYEKAAGLIRDWVPQVTFRLGDIPIVYRLDFLVWKIDGTTEGHETKGRMTEKAEIILDAWAAHGPCLLKIYTNGKLVNVINPKILGGSQ